MYRSLGGSLFTFLGYITQECSHWARMNLYLTSVGTTRLFYELTVRLHSPASSVGGLPFLHILTFTIGFLFVAGLVAARLYLVFTDITLMTHYVVIQSWGKSWLG